MSKLQIAGIASLICALLVGLLIWHHKLEADRAQAVREAEYRARLAMFQRDLPLGSHRSEVYDYLRLHSVQFGEANGKDALIQIGTEPAQANSICSGFYVRVLFEFNELPNQQKSSPLDNLRAITIDKDCQK